MTNKKNRFIVIIVGFFLLIIPIIFFIYNLKSLLDFSKERTKETLRQKLLNTAQKVEESLNPFNYLKNEFTKIHSELLPDSPEEIINGIPDKTFINNLYNKKLFQKLLEKTKERFAPIIVLMGTNNFSKIYYYFSPELEKDFESSSDRIGLFCTKAYYDNEIVNDRWQQFFPNSKILISDKIFLKHYKEELTHNEENDSCYKYISAYVRLKNNYSAIYTDYFDKQTLYPIIKSTFSKNGIHGYYSLIIPQNHINPQEIVDAILNNKNQDVNVELVDDIKPIQLDDTPEGGIEYRFNFSTHFINHVSIYNKFHNDADYSQLLHKQFKLNINYPSGIILLEKLIYYLKISAILISIFYFFFAIMLLKKQNSFKVLITKKLVCILSIIILLPIISILAFIHLSLQNIDDFLDYNVSKSLNNIIEIHRVHDKENSARRVASVFELKKRIAKTELIEKNLYNGVLTREEGLTWFNDWNNGLKVLSDKNQSFRYSDRGEKDTKSKESEYKIYTEIFRRYLSNLGILKLSEKEEKNFFKAFSLGILEQYFSLEQEEKVLSQESVPNRDIFNFMKKESSVFILAKDINKTNYLMYTKKTNTNNRPYNYISSFTEKIDPLWYNPYNRFADINLKIVFRADSNNKIKRWPPFQNSHYEINKTITSIVEFNNSGTENIKSSQGTTTKQWIIEDDDPLMFLGIAERKKDLTVSYILDISIAILLTYALILLFLLTGFISVFINKPVAIYKEAIDKLANNQYGTTIKSFSKDEFNYITKAFNEMSIAIKQKEQIKRYVSDKLIESVKENNIQEAGKGKQEKVTILSSDIRNFTGISEMYEPSVIVEMLNTYFTQMQKAISDNGGIIDKYIGDAIQAVFYDEPQMENHVIRASKAALEMRKALEEYNKNREQSGLFTIQNGIGIDTDFAITGTIGTKNGRKDFSVNGDVIARAANLEAKTKLTQSKILISKASISSLAPSSSSLLSNIIYKEFDDESVELINVKE